MNATTAVRSDVLPAVGSLLIPGVVAAGPWLALAWGEPHNLKAFVDSNEGFSTAAGAGLIIAVGLVVDSVGTFVESLIVDRWHQDHVAFEQRWREYLKIVWVREPIGQRYLRRVLVNFKFELNLLVAIVTSGMPGTLALNHYGLVSGQAAFWIIILSLVFAGYLSYAMFDDSKVLHRLRGDLLEVAKSQNPKAKTSISFE